MSIKETAVLGAAIGTLLVLVAKVASTGLPSVAGESRMLRVRLFPQHSSITHLDKVDFSGACREFFVDRVEFPEGKQLSHPSLGDLYYKSDFGMEITGTFQLENTANYLFEVASDDGFSLKIDDGLVGEYRADRPQEKTVLHAVLGAGRHQAVVYYFQGFGPLGLSVRYKKEGSDAWHSLGETADGCRFIRY